jgi:hypothetical protein
MMFGQLSNRESLRDLIVALEAHHSKCYHFGMFQLFPVAIITDFLLVLFAKCLSFKTIAGSKCGDAYRGGLNLLLLKKTRTQN